MEETPSPPSKTSSPPSKTPSPPVEIPSPIKTPSPPLKPLFPPSEPPEEGSYEWVIVNSAKTLMLNIITSKDKPKPIELHKLAALVESHSGDDQSETAEAKLHNAILENVQFFKLVSSKFLSNNFPISITAAAARVCLSLRSLNSFSFNNDIMRNIIKWVLHDDLSAFGLWDIHFGGTKSSNLEMLKTYSTGLLASCLAWGNLDVEEAASVPGLSTEIMKYLCEQAESCKAEDNVAACQTTEERELKLYLPDCSSLHQMRGKYCIQVLWEFTKRGFLGDLLHGKGVDVCISLLEKFIKAESFSIVPNILMFISASLGSKKFAISFVKRQGIQKLLALPRDLESFFGLSTCLLTIGSIQNVMEFVCSIPSTLNGMVGLGLQLLQCPNDEACNNASKFFKVSFTFEAVVTAFDKMDGLKLFVKILDSSIHLISAPYLPKKRRYRHTCLALQKYFRAQLVLLVDSRKTCGRLKVGCKISLNEKSIDAVCLQMRKDQGLGQALLLCKWPTLETFLASNGLVVMLRFCQAPLVDRYLCGLAMEVLYIVTILPSSHKVILNATLSKNHTGIGVILHAAGLVDFTKPHINKWALKVLINLLCPLHSLNYELEEECRKAREVFCLNNGIPLVLRLLKIRLDYPVDSLDSIRALACQVLLGLVTDEAKVKMLRNFQASFILLDMLRNLDNQIPGYEQTMLQMELREAATKLIAILMNSSMVVVGDTLALRDTERDAIVASTRITYNSGELLQLVHEHLQVCGLFSSASVLMEEAQLMPLSSSSSPSLADQEMTSSVIEWPCGRTPKGFLWNKMQEEELLLDSDLTVTMEKKPLSYLQNMGSECHQSSRKLRIPSLRRSQCCSSRRALQSTLPPEPPLPSTSEQIGASETQTPTLRSVNRKSTVFTPEISNDVQPVISERSTLNSIIIQYLKQQHHQCTQPTTTLPPISLLQRHSCHEPRRRIGSQLNITAQLSSCELTTSYGNIHRSRRHRHFVYSQFRPWRTCRDAAALLLTRMTFLGDSTRIAIGSSNGELRIFETNSNNKLRFCTSHGTPISPIEHIFFSNSSRLILSSDSFDTKLWGTSEISDVPIHLFEGCRDAHFCNQGSYFAALPVDRSKREILLYDLSTYQLDRKLSDTSAYCQGPTPSTIHFNPSDVLLLWNGSLWDTRVSSVVHRFDNLSDYGGGGFHPNGNEVILNSEVWDVRKLRQLLRSVPSLDKTTIQFSNCGHIIYARSRSVVRDLLSEGLRHKLFSAFRTLDAVDYSDIATIPVDSPVLDLALEPTNSIVGLLTLDSDSSVGSFTREELLNHPSSARLYEIGCGRHAED